MVGRAIDSPALNLLDVLRQPEHAVRVPTARIASAIKAAT